MLSSIDELRAFVASLRIPEARRAVVELELLDHVESRIATDVARGCSPDEATLRALAALGDPFALRASLERVEPAFAISPAVAVGRGLISAVAVSALFAIGGALADELPFAARLAMAAALAACAVAVLWFAAPRGMGAAVRAELRASTDPAGRSGARRRAVQAYLASLLAVSAGVWIAWLGGLSDRARDDILLPTSLVALAYGAFALALMRQARRERSRARVDLAA